MLMCVYVNVLLVHISTYRLLTGESSGCKFCHSLTRLGCVCCRVDDG